MNGISFTGLPKINGRILRTKSKETQAGYAALVKSDPFIKKQVEQCDAFDFRNTLKSVEKFTGDFIKNKVKQAKPNKAGSLFVPDYTTNKGKQQLKKEIGPMLKEKFYATQGKKLENRPIVDTPEVKQLGESCKTLAEERIIQKNLKNNQKKLEKTYQGLDSVQVAAKKEAKVINANRQRLNSAYSPKTLGNEIKNIPDSKQVSTVKSKDIETIENAYKKPVPKANIPIAEHNTRTVRSRLEKLLPEN